MYILKKKLKIQFLLLLLLLLFKNEQPNLMYLQVFLSINSPFFSYKVLYDLFIHETNYLNVK